MRDGQEVTSDVISTEKLANGNWYYQIHSQLEYTPKSGEQISCMVEHASLDKPIVEHWGELSILLVLTRIMVSLYYLLDRVILYY